MIFLDIFLFTNIIALCLHGLSVFPVYDESELPLNMQSGAEESHYEL